jgi:hypothetical protein
VGIEALPIKREGADRTEPLHPQARVHVFWWGGKLQRQLRGDVGGMPGFQKGDELSQGPFLDDELEP